MLQVLCAPLQDLACVDMAIEVAERALEVVRSQIEAAAAAAKEAASHSLLRELEEEAAQHASAKQVSAVAHMPVVQRQKPVLDGCHLSGKY